MNFVRRARLLVGIMVVALLAACNAPNHPHGSSFNEVNATPPAGLSGAGLQAWTILHAPRPPRDLVALAAQMRNITAPQQVRSTPLNEALNNDETFWLPTGPNQYRQITAKLVYITPHVYDYVEDGAVADLSALRASADLFENSIYVTDRRIFGSEWTPGVDDDPHITILNAASLDPNLSGYFSSSDEYANQIIPVSNQREMLYMHTGDGYLTPNTDGYNDALARSFAHMIHWHLRPSDPSWLDNGLALLAQHINGFDAAGADQAFLAAPDTQLNAWCADPACNPPYYGAAFLFLDYFAEQYGGYNILKELLSDPAQAPLNFNDVLAAHGYSDRFDDVFAKWVMANALNDEPQGSNGTYAYKTITDEHAQPQHIVASLPYSDQGRAHQYAAQYYDAKMTAGQDQTLHVTFTGATSVPLLSAPAAPSGGAFWWSNTGANLAATLTRTFDLTHLAGQPVQLSFALWYDLQLDRDYGYVSVSTDGGKTWQPQRFDGSRGANPNGLNLGNGLTGASGNTWQAESVDLSAYAGKMVQVRFAAVTDYGQTGQGMALDRVQVNGQTIAPTDGWQAQGWLRITNSAPETYVVQVAIFASDGAMKTVTRMPVDASGKGQLAIPHVGKQVSRVLIAVAAYAPVTTQTTGYTLTLATGG